MCLTRADGGTGEFAGGARALVPAETSLLEVSPRPRGTYVNNAARKPTSGNKMIFARINLCEIENPARLHYFRVYGARGRGEPENVCEPSRKRCDRLKLASMWTTQDCGCNVSTALYRFYVCRRKNYTFTSEIISLSEWFAATWLNCNSASIKTDPCRSKRERYVCNL